MTYPHGVLGIRMGFAGIFILWLWIGGREARNQIVYNSDCRWQKCSERL
jgi:hypothetical protein